MTLSANQLKWTESLGKRFRETMELVPIALLIVDPDGKICLVNLEAETLFGYNREEMLGQSFELLVPKRFRREPGELDTGFFGIPRSQGVDTGQNLYGLQKNGDEIPIEIRFNSVQHEGRDFLMSTIVDFQAWEISQAQLIVRTGELAQSNAELEAFAKIAAHDLQEPLRKITSSLRALVEDHADKLESDARRWIDYTVDGAKRMQNLVSDLLAFSLFHTHSEPIQAVDANAILSRVLDKLAINIEESSAQITCHALPLVLADEKQLMRLLHNLIDNAIRFRSVRVPNIEIGVETIPDGVVESSENGETKQDQRNDYVFYVRDNSIGIAPEYFQRIFIAFQRLHSRHAYQGTGMGLAVCKKIVERHGGRIWVESTPGKGSTFYFTWK